MTMFGGGKGKRNEEVQAEAVEERPKTRIERLEEQKRQAEAQYSRLEEPARQIGQQLREARARISYIDNNMPNATDFAVIQDLLEERETMVKRVSALLIAENASRHSLDTARAVIGKFDHQISEAIYRANNIKAHTIPYIRSDIASMKYQAQEAKRTAEIYESKVREYENNMSQALAELKDITGEEI